MNRGKTTKSTLNASNWWASHRHGAVSSLRRMAAAPVSTAMTVVVIAVALLLPMLLFATHASFAALLAEFRESARLTLYLQEEVSETEALEVRDDLLTSPGIRAVEYISPAQALAEFEAGTGLRGALVALDQNPLPGSLVVTPDSLDSAGLEALSKDLLTLEEVGSLRLDTEWIQRLDSVASLVAAAGRVLLVIVALGLVFITGNTIKLAIDNRRDEIRVIKLVGGTDAYIARPFLYFGFFLGLFGAVTASILAMIAQLAIRPALAGVMARFDTTVSIISLNMSLVLQVLVAGALLGWLAALLASLRYLRTIEA